jgi:hypothetical protein
MPTEEVSNNVQAVIIEKPGDRDVNARGTCE